MNARRKKTAGLRWLQGAFGAFSPCVTCQKSRRRAFELEAWKMIESADDETQRAIFGATVDEILVNDSSDSDNADFWHCKSNALSSNAARIGRFAISLNNAGKSRLLKSIATHREWGHSWYYIAESVDCERRCEQNRASAPSWLSWLLPEAGEYPKRGSSRALIFEIAERLTERGAAK